MWWHLIHFNIFEDALGCQQASLCSCSTASRVFLSSFSSVWNETQRLFSPQLFVRSVVLASIKHLAASVWPDVTFSSAHAEFKLSHFYHVCHCCQVKTLYLQMSSLMSSRHQTAFIWMTVQCFYCEKPTTTCSSRDHMIMSADYKTLTLKLRGFPFPNIFI